MPRRVLPQVVIDHYLGSKKPARRERVPIALTEARVRKLSMYPNMTSDGGCMGLWVRTSPRLTQSYCFRYQWRGKRHEMGLGPTEVVQLQEARAMVLAARHLMVVEGKDPLIQRRKARAEETRASVTFGDVLASYLDIHSVKWSRKERLSEEWQNSLGTHTPSLIAMSIQDVDTDAIVEALKPLWVPERVKLGDRIRYRVEAVLGFAQSSGLRTGENPARKRHHLANLLPAIERHAEKARYESLPYQEIAPLMHQLTTMAGSVAACLRFLILTGVRTSEVRLASWSEIDLANKVWTIPGARMKVGKEHRVSLSPQALAILEQQRGKHPVVVFPGNRRGAKGPAESSLIQLLKRTGCDATVHGFRASLKTWASEETDHAKEVIEACLAHAIGNQVEQAYQRGTFFAKRVGLMNQWGEYVTAEGG